MVEAPLEVLENTQATLATQATRASLATEDRDPPDLSTVEEATEEEAILGATLGSSDTQGTRELGILHSKAVRVLGLASLLRVRSRLLALLTPREVTMVAPSPERKD